jgi:glycerate kinase
LLFNLKKLTISGETEMTDRDRPLNSMRGVPTRVLVAPDKFRGTLSAAKVAAAVAAGLERGGREAERCPVADGGEGTLAALGEAYELERRRATVSDPLGRPVRAAFGIGHWARRPTAVVESAAASGLALLAESERDPLAASSAGTGELIVAAREAGARTILVGVGGSASTDGGAGALEAIAARGGLDGVRLVVLCDVRIAFEEAAARFAPQKGADRRQVRALERRLDALARKLPRDPRGVPLTGAAGGLAGGLWAALGAELVAGASFVLDALGFDARMHAARAVVTGEGCLDRTSLAGKLVSEIATRARQSGVPCHAIVGSRELDDFGARMLDLERVLLAGTPAALRRAGAKLAAVL